MLLNATLCMTLYVRAIDHYGAAAVAMLFAVIPAIAGVLSWLLLGLGYLAPLWTEKRQTFQDSLAYIVVIRASNKGRGT